MTIQTVAQIIVSVGSLSSVFLAKLRPFAPWILLFGAHGLFLAYAIATQQFGFIPMNLGMMTAAVFNYYQSWKRRDDGTGRDR